MRNIVIKSYKDLNQVRITCDDLITHKVQPSLPQYLEQIIVTLQHFVTLLFLLYLRVLLLLFLILLHKIRELAVCTRI